MKYMKNKWIIRCIVFLVCFFAVNLIPNVKALETVMGEYRFGFSAYECSGTKAAEFKACREKYYKGQLAQLDTSQGLPAGKKIMLVIEYTHGFAGNINNAAVGFNTNLIFDTDYVELMTYGSNNSPAAWAATEVLNPVFAYSEDEMGPYGFGYDEDEDELIKPDSGWNANVTPPSDEYPNLAIFNYERLNQSVKPFAYNAGAIGFAFFEVKADAPEGSNFIFYLDRGNEGDATWMSDSDTNPIPFQAEPITLKTAGESTSSDNSLKTFTAKGSNNESYTVYEDSSYTTAFGNDTSVREYYMVVPNNVTSVTLNLETNHENAQIVPGNANTLTKTYDLTKVGQNKIEFFVSAEDVTNSTYNLYVYRLSDDATLKSLSLTNSNINISFNSGTYSYSPNVLFGVKKTNVNATPTHANASIVTGGTGAWNLINYGDTPNVKTITVKAEDCNAAYASVPENTCHTKDYTVTVNRGNPSTSVELSQLNVNSRILNKTTIPAGSVDGFTSATTQRQFDLGIVDYETSQLTFTATPKADSNGVSPTIVSGTGTKNLSVGQNTFTITVKAEDDHTENYVIKVYRKSNNTNLGTLEVTSNPSGTLAPAFDDHSYGGPYTYHYPSDVTSVTISATVEDTGKAEVNGNLGTYTDLDKTATIIVTSENGDTKTFTIQFEKILSTDNLLSDLTATNATLTPEVFNPNTNTYTATVDGNIETTTISASLHDPKAKFVEGYGPRTVNLQYGENTIPVRVQSEYGQTNGGGINSYNIVITRNKKSIKSLDSVTITALVDGVEQDILATYNSQAQTYSIPALPYETTSAKISAVVPEGSLATYTVFNQENGATVDGTIDLATGSNIAKIRVKAHDGSTADYNVSVPRTKNNVTGITGVKVFGDDATCEGTTCTITVENVHGTLAPSDVEISIQDENARVTKPTNTMTLSTAHTSTFAFTVTAENGTDSANYELVITRKKSDDNTLSKVTVTTNEGKAYECNSFTNFACTIAVPATTTSYTLEATKSSNAAELSGTGTYTMGGSEGSLQTRTLTVTSESNISQTYQITIERSKSTNANLASITIDGEVIEGFDGVNKQIYTVTVPGTTSAINLNATVDDVGKAVIENSNTVLGKKNLIYGDNTYTIKVIAEAGGSAVKTYTLTVKRSNNIDPTLTMIQVGGSNLPDFASDKTSYKYNDATYQALGSSNILVVPYNTTSISVLGTPSDTEHGTVKYNDGTDALIPLHTGANTIKITGIAHNTSYTKDYTVVVYRSLNNNNAVSKIEIAGNEAIYNEETGRYSVTVPNSVTSVSTANVVVTLPAKQLETDPDATVTIPNKDLVTTAVNQYQIIVLAESGDSRTYDIDITRTKSNVNTLSSLTVTDGSFNPSFSPNTTEYTVTLPASATEFTINYVKADDTERVEGAGKKTLTASTMDVEVNVFAEDNTPNKYTLHIVRTTSAVSTLSSITVNSGDEYFRLDRDFSPDHTSYEVEVPGTVTEVNLNAVVTDNRATIRTGDLGTKSVSLGDNPFTIRVNGEANSSFTDYNINIKVLPKTINTLDSITVTLEDGTELALSPEFDSERANYVLANQAYGVDKVNVAAVKTDDDSTIVSGLGEQLLQTGSNTLVIVVKAQDNTENKYYIKVERAKNDDATLKTLNVSGTSLSPSFNPNTFEYNVELESDVTRLTPSDITAIANDTTGASVNKGLAMDVTTEYQAHDIIVTAENGDAKTYTINVKRKKSSDAKLKSVELVNASISPAFSSNNDEYTLTIPSTATEFTITGTANDTENATVEGNNTYPKTTDKVVLKVIAEDETEKEYTFNVITAEALDATLASLEIQGYTLSPEFGRTTIEYNIGEVPFGTTNLKVLATTTNPNADIKYYVDGVEQSSNTVTIPQALGSKSITVKVIPATGVESQSRSYSVGYTLVSSANNYLASLVPSTGTLNPTFQRGKNAYSMTVPYETENISFSLVTEDTSASVSNNKTEYKFTSAEPATYEYPLNVGSNNATFTVKAANGRLQDYTVAITRTNRTPSSNTTLSNLQVVGYELSPAFKADVDEYSIGAIPFSLDKLTVKATGSIAGQTITYSLNGTEVAVDDPANAVINVSKTSGSNLINVHVVAENGIAASNYQISYTKTPSNNTYLASMVDSMHKIKNFNKNTQDYTIDVDSTVNSLTLTLATEEEHAKIGIGTTTKTHQWAYEVANIKGGTNKVTIIVTAENGETKTYTLTINKEGASELITSLRFGHKIENGMIKTSRLHETLLDQKNELDNDNTKLQIWNADETEEITDLGLPVATGQIVKLVDLTNGSELDRKIIVVVGDTSGDGEVDLFDAVKILNDVLGYSYLGGAYKEAGYVNDDSDIDLYDAVKILNHVLGRELIKY